MRLLSLALAAFLPGAALACGPTSDCEIENGVYRIQLPQDRAEGASIGAIVFAHGYRGTAAGTMKSAGLTRVAQDLGVALIAIKSFDEDWTIPNAPSAGLRPERDEVAYVDRVIEDATARFNLDPSRLLATGFSAGGMMVWELACRDSGRFAGFVPMSGTFWAPEPATCSAPPANLIHYHGTEDRVVPVQGRPIGRSRQGDLREVMMMYRAYGGYDRIVETAPAPDSVSCRSLKNAGGKLLELCTFPGGHGFRATYLRRAWNVLVPPA